MKKNEGQIQKSLKGRLLATFQKLAVLYTYRCVYLAPLKKVIKAKRSPPTKTKVDFCLLFIFVPILTQKIEVRILPNLEMGHGR